MSNHLPPERREIKFRCWFDGIKSMGNVISLTGSNRNDYKGDIWDKVVAECFVEGRQQFYESYNFKLLQFTGLKDKNGKEIYEGDIVDVKFGYDFMSQSKYSHGHCVVMFSEEEVGFILMRPEDNQYSRMSGYYLPEFEVITNIYEKSEAV